MTGQTSRAGSPNRTFRWIGLGLALLGAVLVATPGGLAQGSNASIENTTLVSDVGRPVDLAIAPDGELWWADMDVGNVTRYDPEEGTREVVFHRDPLPDPAERGLVGLALDSGFADNGVFYVYYTVPDPEDPEGGTNHLSRIEDGEETRLLSVPANVWHNGGRITFDGEGRLFVSTGDNQRGHAAQDPGSRLGKILHLWPNGTPAGDTIEGYVYSMGHRNVYGLAYDEANDRLFATENGKAERDEINLIEAGNNYGWPDCEGFHRYDYENETSLDEPCEEPVYTDPIAVFYDNRTTAPTGATVFRGDLHWASLKEADVHRLVEDPVTGEWSDGSLFEANDEIYDLEAHDGSLYYAARGEIVRLEIPPYEETPGGEPGALTETPGLGAAAAALLSLAAGFLANVAGARRR